MVKLSPFIASAFLFSAQSSMAFEERDFRKSFDKQEGCFVVLDLSNGKVFQEYNEKRYAERFAPQSSFKIAAALMAFEKGVLKNENQVMRWDGVPRDRKEEDQDQTPYTWMRNSVVWVTQWITSQLGLGTIQQFLDEFSYGNRDFSGGITEAWLTSSLKISAHEQLAFMTKLWKERLPVSKRTADLTKKIIFIKKLGKESELFGKTGTGCLDGPGCMKHPGRMLGWFVGVLRSGAKEYAFAANASDLAPATRGAGPRLYYTTIEILTGMGLVK